MKIGGGVQSHYTYPIMLMFIFSRLLAGWFTFLLPSYYTFKALRQRPLHGKEIEKWASYWIVVGAVVAFEYTAEWLLCWLPFYWEIKTLFLLFLSLPQFEGSTFLYKSYIEPYLVQNESDIDASIASARNETFQFIQTRLSTLWDLLYSLLSKTPITSNLNQSPSGAAPANGSPHNGQNALFQSVQGLWGAISPPAYSAAPTAVSGKYTVSRSASDTVAPEKQPASDSSVAVGYDADATTKD
ncbi:TB2/DP1, HVA22 family-domain-containing protein [Russula aff. rugulosa BPL654]|nr:TB2/DP1, HVA22 family-domain-containing protein [Russula aff. rugulosa BPL654]